MNPNSGLGQCDHIQLMPYLDGETSEHASSAVEEHLATCESCRQTALTAAASGEQWKQTRRLLSQDEFDRGECLSSVIGLATGDLTELDRVQSAGDAGMLSREIQGWLDPTDDPKSLGRFAGYEITGIVGHGGMGIVLKGFEVSLNRFVAIKVLAPRLATNGTARKRFAREAQAAAAVIHENVIAIHRVDQWHGLPFLVMPYLGGVSLQKRIDDEGPLSIEATLRIGSQIADGLAAAHAHGLVHRDIKPANIMLDRGVDRVTITDFGLARAIDDASVTRTGIIAGTPQYMSPEQAQAKAIDARSDLFSLGSVLYAMGTGRCPFRDEGSYKILQRIIHDQARGMREVDPSIPRWFENLVYWLHAKSPSDRPQSAEDVKRLIDVCLRHITQPSESLPNELLAGMKPKSQRRWIAIGLGLAIAVLLCFMIPLFPQAPTENGDEAGSNPQQVAADADRAKGKQVGSALGKPIFEGDFDREDKTGKELMLLVVRLLEEDYCKQHPGLEPGEDVRSRIKNDGHRESTLYMIRRSRLQRHLYEKHGGRVLLSPFGAMAFDGQKKWLEEREQLGEFQITDPQLRATFYDFWKQDYGWKLTEDPIKIKAAFDPEIEERLIASVEHIPAGAASDTQQKLVGTVFGRPLHVHQRYFADDVELSNILYHLFITPLEENYRKQHPEVEPTDVEIDRLATRSKSNDEQTKRAYHQALDNVVSKQQGLDPKSDRYLELQSEKTVIEYKLKDAGGRALAADLARPLKFQTHLYDHYGGGRALRTPQGAIAFDAQQRWVEQREALGEFRIADPKIRKLFYEHWTKGEQRHGAMLIDEPKRQGWFDSSWLVQSNVNPDGKPKIAIKAGDRTIVENEVNTKVMVTEPQRVEATSREFPAEQVEELIGKQKRKEATSQTELQRITGLDFSAATSRESRRAWLDWWSHEQANIENALNGRREFIVIGKITDPEGQPISNALVQAYVASESNASGRFRLGSTISDINGSCVLFFGYFEELPAGAVGPSVTFTAAKSPTYSARSQDEPSTLILSSSTDGEGADQKTLLVPRRPRGMKFVLHPTARLRVQVVNPDGELLTPEKLSMRLGPPDAPLPEDAEEPERMLRPLKGGVFFATLVPPQSVEFHLQATNDSPVHRSTTRLVAKTAGDFDVQLIYSPDGKLEIKQPE